MTLRELLSHFVNKTTWVDLCTPQWRKCGEIRQIQVECADILDMQVSNWTYTNSLNIEMSTTHHLD